MQTKILFISLLLMSLSLQVIAQNRRTTTQQGMYQDRITDQYGNPLPGVKVKVMGKGVHTYSDHNGYFSIRAKNGDKIILSKNGERINSYRLDGSLNYEIEDLSQVDEAVEYKKNKRSARKEAPVEIMSKSNTRNVFYLDSAALYLHKDAFKSIDFVEKHFKYNNSTTKTLERGYELLGDNYFQLKQYDLAVSNYKTAVSYTNSIDLSIKYAKALTKSELFNESNTEYQKLLTNDLSAWQNVLVNEGLGNNEKNKGHIDAALSYFKKALQTATKDNITPKISSLNTEIASLLASKGRINQANIHIQNTMEVIASEPIRERVSMQNKVADVYQSNQDYDNEIKIRRQTLNELEDARIESVEIVTKNEKEEDLSASQLNLDIGRAFIDKHEYGKAIPYLEASVSKASENNDLEIQKNAIQKLSELYKKIGNSKKALQNYQEYVRLVDALYQQKELEIQEAKQLANDLREKQNRINSLEKDRELSLSKYQLSVSEQELTIANYRRQKVLINALIFGLVLFSFVLYFMYLSNKQRRLANNLLALKSLRSQMNPHFIFNALNSVNSFIAQSDERAANKYLTDFSTLMRSVLHNSEEDFIPLNKEIELIELYIKLEHSRFKDRFDYYILIDDNLNVDDFEIPPMLLQPYIENAVWHGLRYKKTKGKLQIDFRQKDKETVIITIEDDGIGRKKSKELKTKNQKKQQSKGMGNIKKRVQILNEMYSDKVDVSISNVYEDESGTRVILILKND